MIRVKFATNPYCPRQIINEAFFALLAAVDPAGSQAAIDAVNEYTRARIRQRSWLAEGIERTRLG